MHLEHCGSILTISFSVFKQFLEPFDVSGCNIKHPLRGRKRKYEVWFWSDADLVKQLIHEKFLDVRSFVPTAARVALSWSPLMSLGKIQDGGIA